MNLELVLTYKRHTYDTPRHGGPPVTSIQPTGYQLVFYTDDFDLLQNRIRQAELKGGQEHGLDHPASFNQPFSLDNMKIIVDLIILLQHKFLSC